MTMELPFEENPQQTLPLPRVFDYLFDNYLVRVTGTPDEPWFVAKDVCDAIGIDLPANSLRYLDDDEKGMSNVHTPGGDQRLSTINESGLYSLVLRSRKPQAKVFKKWITSEVIPSIRKRGSYVAAPVQPMTREQRLMIGLEAAQELNHELEQEKKALELKVDIDLPKVHFFDHLSNNGKEGLQTFTDSRHLLKLKVEGKELNRNEFIQFLVDKKYIYRQGKEIRPYEKWSKAGYFIRRSVTWPDPTDPDGVRRKTGYQTLISPAGLSHLHEKFSRKD